MRRERIIPRVDYAAKLEAQGLSFHAKDNYWREDACYRFTLDEVERIEAATNELHGLYLEALEHVIKANRLGELKVPQAFWDPIAASFKRGDFSLYGRFDLAFNGQNAPKMLEYNADTPTSLLESAVCQWFWLKDKFPDADQFNSIHERLIARWRKLPGSSPVHLAYVEGNEEDWACTTYLMDTLAQAGRKVEQMTVEEIGWDPKNQFFVDLAGRPIEYLFKLYPWEWLMREEFGKHIPGASTRFIEPLWKAVLSCKGMLPILWELFPNHPNLLPAYFDSTKLVEYARKPLYSREGANVELFSGVRKIEGAQGPYGSEGHIYQQRQELTQFDGHYPIIGSWTVGGESAGMCIREDTSLITSNTSHFVPHYFSD